MTDTRYIWEEEIQVLMREMLSDDEPAPPQMPLPAVSAPPKPLTPKVNPSGEPEPLTPVCPPGVAEFFFHRGTPEYDYLCAVPEIDGPFRCGFRQQVVHIRTGVRAVRVWMSDAQIEQMNDECG